MDPPAAEPADRGFSRTVIRALRSDGLRVAFVVAVALVVAPIARMFGFATTAERLERDLGDPRMLAGNQAERSSRSAADVGVELIDEIGLPDAPRDPSESPEDLDGEGTPSAQDAAPDDEAPTATATAAEPVPQAEPVRRRADAPLSASEWLTGLREKEARELQRAEEDRARHLGREATLFRFMLVIGVIATVFAIIGALLLLAGLVPAGVVSIVIAILPGSGSVLIRDLWKHEREKVQDAETKRSEYAAMVEAAEAALSLADEADRSREALEIARRLRERAFTR